MARRGRVLLGASLAAVVALATPAPVAAQPDDDDGELDDDALIDDDDDARDVAAAPWVLTGEPPPGYKKFEVVDLTIGMRDDSFTSAVPGKNGTVWVSTWNGRAYFSADRGQTWRESTVITSRPRLYGFAGQRMLLGSLRKDGARVPELLDTGGAYKNFRNWALMRGDLPGSVKPGALETASGKSSDDVTSRHVYSSTLASDPMGIPLKLSEDAVSGGGGLLGAGLSSRAPRLSLLLTIMRRPTAVISLARLLLTTASKKPYVYAVYQSAADDVTLFAQTANGLYQSTDKGYSWVRAFPGPNPAERNILRVTFDSKNPQRIYMGTGRGLYISNDGGRSFTKSTRVPEIAVRWVAVDPVDPNYVYVAGTGGVYRSSNRGQDFVLAYYHSLRKRRDVGHLTIDPFDSNTGYLGTGDGVMVTHNLRNGTSQDWELLSGLRTANLNISKIEGCSKHPGHYYMLTAANLPVINYMTNGPESLFLETWDHGKSWRPLAGNRTRGSISAFVIDPEDPDTVWIAFSDAVVRIERRPDQAEDDGGLADTPLTLAPVLPGDPTLGEVVDAALDHHGLSLDLYTDKLDRLRRSRFVPTTLNVSLQYGQRSWGSAQEDVRFPTASRYRANSEFESWRVMAYASWELPDIVHRGIDSNAMLRYRVAMMGDEVRNRILSTVFRNYGELQRLKVRQRTSSPSRDPYLRAVERVRIEYLEAVVDLASGGFLSRWKKKKAGR